MGNCGATVYPKNPQVEQAQNIPELVAALKEVSKKYNEEISDLESHIKKKTDIKTYGMEGMDDESVKKRIPYLGAMTDSLAEIIKTLNASKDELPLKDAKEYIQNFLGHYYVAYDENKGYAKDADSFKQFAAPYKKA